MIGPTEFARIIGVSHQAVSKAIKAGRVPVYDEHEMPCSADYRGRKFVKENEARAAFRLSRSRVDDHMLAEIAAETAAEVDLVDDVEPHDGGRKAGVILPPPISPISPAVSGTLTGVKTEKEQLQSELLRLRLARERGELIARQAQIDAFEQAGRRVANELQSISQWAEEITSIAHAAGVSGVTAFLRTKGIEFCAHLADLMVLDQDSGGSDDERESDSVD